MDTWWIHKSFGKEYIGRNFWMEEFWMFLCMQMLNIEPLPLGPSTQCERKLSRCHPAHNMSLPHCEHQVTCLASLIAMGTNPAGRAQRTSQLFPHRQWRPSTRLLWSKQESLMGALWSLTDPKNPIKQITNTELHRTKCSIFIKWTLPTHIFLFLSCVCATSLTIRMTDSNIYHWNVK